MINIKQKDRTRYFKIILLVFDVENRISAKQYNVITSNKILATKYFFC